MPSERRSASGFTLVELMVVASLVAILAVSSAAMMSGSKKRAMVTEAEAALGSIRTAMRAMYAETGDYTRTPLGKRLKQSSSVTVLPGIEKDALAGVYFNAASYRFTSLGQHSYLITANGDHSTAPNASDVRGTQVNLTHNGKVTLKL